MKNIYVGMKVKFIGDLNLIIHDLPEEEQLFIKKYLNNGKYVVTKITKKFVEIEAKAKNRLDYLYVNPSDIEEY